MDVVMLYATWPDLEQAERAARTLVENRLAACVNLVPGVVSVYRWEGEITRDGEVLMLAKTAAARAPEARDVLLKMHPYALPSITAFCVDSACANGDFLNWVKQQTC